MKDLLNRYIKRKIMSPVVSALCEFIYVLHRRECPKENS